MTESNYHARIGAFVLESLTTGMYRNPLDALREYVQNSFDSIRKAEFSGIIKPNAGRITINIAEKSRTISIRDNGTGISETDVAESIVNIGMSEKSIETDAGFRGIGRLAGIAYCDKLIFKTQSRDENIISTVTYESNAIKDAISPKNRKAEELADVLNQNINILTEKTSDKDHFFEVTMEGINTSGEIFLDSNEVRLYLEQVAPLPIDTQSFHFAKLFYDWVKNTGVSLPEVNIILHKNGTSYELFKPYKKITYSTTKGKDKVHVKNIKFFPENPSAGSPFWIWYAETNCPGSIQNPSVAGIRLRKSNIAIGMSERMSEIFRSVSESYGRFNRFFIGEVHIQDPLVIPNGHRDDFEDTPEWIEIKNELVRFAKERSKEAYSLSHGRNADIEKLLSNANKQLYEVNKKQKTGLASKKEQTKIKEHLGKCISKIETAEKADRSSDELDRLSDARNKLLKAQDVISNETKYTVQTLKSSLDKKQRKIISEIITVLYEVLDESNFEAARNAILEQYQIPEKELN